MRDDVAGFGDSVCLAHRAGVSGDDGGITYQVCGCSTATNQSYGLATCKGNACYLRSSRDIICNNYQLSDGGCMCGPLSYRLLDIALAGCHVLVFVVKLTIFPFRQVAQYVGSTLTASHHLIGSCRADGCGGQSSQSA